MSRTTNSILTAAATVALVGSAAFIAPGTASAAGAASGTINLRHSVTVKTLTFELNVSGTQYQYADENGTLFSNPEPDGTRIDFGDGSLPDGSDGGAETCRPGTNTNAYSFKGAQQTHTYAEAGTYTVTVPSGYCGAQGRSELTKKYTVVVPGKDAPAPTKPWISVSMPHTMVGRTLHYGFEAHGSQHYFVDGTGVSSPHSEPAGYTVDFGDGSPESAGQGGGGESCGTQMLASFSMGSKNATPLRHTYAKAGTYKVKYTAYYCGDGG